MPLNKKINFTNTNIVFFQMHPIVSVKRFIDFRFILKEVSFLLTMSSLNKYKPILAGSSTITLRKRYVP